MSLHVRTLSNSLKKSNMLQVLKFKHFELLIIFINLYKIVLILKSYKILRNFWNCFKFLPIVQHVSFVFTCFFSNTFQDLKTSQHHHFSNSFQHDWFFQTYPKYSKRFGKTCLSSILSFVNWVNILEHLPNSSNIFDFFQTFQNINKWNNHFLY